MKRNILYALAGFIVLLSVFACSDDNKYETSVVRQIELFLNDEEWVLNVGISTKPLFVYNSNGEYVANYTSHYRFALENGNYKIVATPAPEDLIPSPVNLNELIIEQDLEAKRKVEISAPVEYSSPFDTPLSISMYSRTGVLRLKAIDKKADKGYSKVRAILTTPISGYRVADATYVKSQVELTRSKETATGGVNYTDDFMVFETQTLGETVNVHIEYLDKDGAIVQSKPMDGAFTILPNTITQIDFQLNDTEHPIIQDYTVSILSEEWSEDNVTPEAPIEVPEGYRYVAPSDNLGSVCNEMFADPQVTELKLFLKAGTTYNLGRLAISKNLSILAQEPAKKQERAIMNMGNASISGDLDYVRFEGLDINVTDSYTFRLGQTPFHVGELLFKNCNMNNLKRCMWYAEVSIADQQFVDNLILDDCRLLNYNAENKNYSLIGMAGTNNPIRNIVMKKTTIHTVQTGLKNTLIGGTRNQTENVSITLENSTFVRLGPAGMTFFDLRADKMEKIILTVKNNLFSGISEPGQGRWMYLDKKVVKDFANNYRTSDFVLSNWGVDASEEPIETVSKDELFIDAAAGDLTVKDKTSVVYSNKIGDPHWIK